MSPTVDAISLIPKRANRAETACSAEQDVKYEARHLMRIEKNQGEAEQGMFKF